MELPPIDKSPIQNMTNEELERICIDFVVNGLTKLEIMDKYHLTERAYYNIADKQKLAKLKQSYIEKRIKKELTKIANKESTTIASAHRGLADHVDGILSIQRRLKNENKLLPSSMVKELMQIVALKAEHKRYADMVKKENEPPSEVEIIMGEGVRSITERKKNQEDIVDAEVVEANE